MKATVAAGRCGGCGLRKRVHSKGRCRACYVRAWRAARAGRAPAPGRALCRHCRVAPVTRGRGLCWSCGGDPAVRCQYRPGTSPGLTDAEILAMPPIPVGDEDPVPDPPRAWPPRSRTYPDDPAGWRRWERAAGGAHPDTSPGAIAAAQRRVVAEALAELGPGATVGAVSDLVILPRDVCERRLAELELGEG